MDPNKPCRVCGHPRENHKSLVHKVLCNLCPDKQCQDGPDVVRPVSRSNQHRE